MIRNIPITERMQEMKRLMITAAALALLATAAQAKDPTTLYRGGAWETYVTRTSGDNKPLCGMAVRGRGSALSIKYSGDEVFVQIFKDGWAIPPDTAIPGWLQFDNTRFAFKGKGYPADLGGWSLVQFILQKGTERDFLNWFSEARQMALGFDQGTQTPFTIDMTGSRGAAQSFRKCANEISEPEPQPQPFAQSKPQGPQPFGAPAPAPVKSTTTTDDGSI